MEEPPVRLDELDVLLLDELLLFEVVFFDDELLLPLEEALLFSGVDFFSEVLLPCCEDALPFVEDDALVFELLLLACVPPEDLLSISVAASASKLIRLIANFVRRSSAWYSSFKVCSNSRATSFNCNSLAKALAVP